MTVQNSSLPWLTPVEGLPAVQDRIRQIACKFLRHLFQKVTVILYQNGIEVEQNHVEAARLLDVYRAR